MPRKGTTTKKSKPGFASRTAKALNRNKAQLNKTLNQVERTQAATTGRRGAAKNPRVVQGTKKKVGKGGILSTLRGLAGVKRPKIRPTRRIIK
jgi:hypothetical protein